MAVLQSKKTEELTPKEKNDLALFGGLAGSKVNDKTVEHSDLALGLALDVRGKVRKLIAAVVEDDEAARRGNFEAKGGRKLSPENIKKFSEIVRDKTTAGEARLNAVLGFLGSEDDKKQYRAVWDMLKSEAEMKTPVSEGFPLPKPKEGESVNTVPAETEGPAVESAQTENTEVLENQAEEFNQVRKISNRILEFLAITTGQKDIEGFKKTGLGEWVRAVSEAVLKNIKDISKANLENIVEDTLGRVNPENLPGLEKLKRERGEDFKNFIKDICAAVRIENKEERRAEIKKLLEKYELSAQAQELAAEAANLAGEINSKAKDKPVTQEEKTEAESKLAKAKTSVKDLMYKIVTFASSIFFMVTMVLLMGLMVALWMSDQVLKGAKNVR